MPIRPAPPQTEAELWSRAQALAGLSLAQLAKMDDCRVPEQLLHAKGWVGQLLERRLGASAGSKDEPDFLNLGIELKTLPVDRVGRPCESTFVCTIPLLDVARTEWLQSRVRRKLNRVLWIIVQGSRDIPVAERRIGEPLLWSPNEEETALLKGDWDELTGLIGRGDIESITGHLGHAMQVRPKARDFAGASPRPGRRRCTRRAPSTRVLLAGIVHRTDPRARLRAAERIKFPAKSSEVSEHTQLYAARRAGPLRANKMRKSRSCFDIGPRHGGAKASIAAGGNSHRTIANGTFLKLSGNRRRPRLRELAAAAKWRRLTFRR